MKNLKSWISERNYFSNSETLLCSNASHQVSAQSDVRFERRCRLKNFKMTSWRLSWISERNDFSNSESLCHSDVSHLQLKVKEEMPFEEFQDGPHESHPGYQNVRILAILNLYNAPMPPIRFRLSLTYGLGGNVV